jgi:hypothetical protein
LDGGAGAWLFTGGILGVLLGGAGDCFC